MACSDNSSGASQVSWLFCGTSSFASSKISFSFFVFSCLTELRYSIVALFHTIDKNSVEVCDITPELGLCTFSIVSLCLPLESRVSTTSPRDTKSRACSTFDKILIKYYKNYKQHYHCCRQRKSQDWFTYFHSFERLTLCKCGEMGSQCFQNKCVSKGPLFNWLYKSIKTILNQSIQDLLGCLPFLWK